MQNSSIVKINLKNSQGVNNGVTTYARQDVSITGHKSSDFLIFKIEELNALGPKSAFLKSISRTSAETYERKTQEHCTKRTQLTIIIYILMILLRLNRTNYT